MARPARAEIIDPGEIAIVHVINRTVRRCFLMGDDPISGKNFDHRKVWIEEGCISCQLCQDICPEVFEVEEGEDCVVTPNAPKHFQGKAEEIREAACDCPVEVIQVEE